MPKLSINILGWNSKHPDIAECIRCILAQEYNDFQLFFSDNGSSNGLLEFVRENFAGHPRLTIIDNGKNLGYAGGHNKFFRENNSELLMVINPDAHLQPRFLAAIVKAFEDPKVGSATGKMLKPGAGENGQRIFDGTGQVVSKARQVRERGQNQVDHGQFDSPEHRSDIFGVSGSAAVYRKAALEDACVNGEYFDPDFFAYYEDWDLAWRLRLMGWQACYVPEAIVEHERAVGQSKSGWKNPIAFVRHYQNVRSKIRRWSWRNHMLTIVKNDFGWCFWKDLPWIVGRQTAFFGYTLFFQLAVLMAIPDFFKLLPSALKKRKIIQSRKKVSSQQMEKWFV